MVKVARSGHKTEDFSESVNSFHLGPIFPASLSHETSRNAFVGTVFGMTPGDSKNARFFDFFEFQRMVRAPSRSVGCRLPLEAVLRCCEGLYESSRAVTQVDGLPRAPSYFTKMAISRDPVDRFC